MNSGPRKTHLNRHYWDIYKNLNKYCELDNNPQNTLCVLLAQSCLTPLSMEYSRQEYYSGLLCPPPGHFPKARDRTQVSCIADRFFTTSTTWEAPFIHTHTLLFWFQNNLIRDVYGVPRHGAVGSISGWGIKTPYASWKNFLAGPKNKKDFLKRFT